jgi:hypothetical protein
MNQATVGLLLLSLIGVTDFSFGPSGASEPLKLEATIPMPDVQGHIDHLSIDLKGQRLFAAALGNNSLEIVDLKQNKLIHSISGRWQSLKASLTFLHRIASSWQTAKTVQSEPSTLQPGRC